MRGRTRNPSLRSAFNARLARRLASDERGATAVEFAMVALPFFFMLFAVLEVGLVFVLDTTLDNAVMETGRLVRTGQAQTMTEAQFLENVCDRMSIFAGDCGDRLTVDVRVLPQFAGQSPPDPMSGGTFSDGGLVFETGDAGQIVLISAWYQHPLFTPMMSQVLSRLDNGIAVLNATTAFRNEPW